MSEFYVEQGPVAAQVRIVTIVVVAAAALLIAGCAMLEHQPARAVRDPFGNYILTPER